MALIPFHGATDGSHRRKCGVCEMARCRRGRQTIRRQKSSPHRVFTRGASERVIPVPQFYQDPNVRVVKNGLSEDLDWEDIALWHEVTVAEAKTLRPFNDRMVSSALFMFRRFIAGLPAGTSVTFQTMEE